MFKSHRRLGSSVTNVSVLELCALTHLHFQMETFAFLLLSLLVCLCTGQHHLRTRTGPWRHRIQWENNGRVYSLLSTGTRYQSPAQPRRHTQLFLTTKNHFNRLQPDLDRVQPLQNLRHVDAPVLGADAGQYFLAPARTGARSQTSPRTVITRGAEEHPSRNGSASAATSIQEFSGTGVPRGGRSAPGENAQQLPGFTHSHGDLRRPSLPSPRAPATSSRVTIAEDGGNARLTPQQPQYGGTPRSAHRAQTLTRVAPETNASPTVLTGNSVEIHFHRPRQDTAVTVDTSDPRDPHRNTVFYNVYPQDRRNRVPVRPNPGPGYGTRLFYQGTAGGRGVRWEGEGGATKLYEN